MFTDRIEGKWVDAFRDVFELCKVTEGEEVAILSETQSRAVNVQVTELAMLAFRFDQRVRLMRCSGIQQR